MRREFFNKLMLSAKPHQGSMVQTPVKHRILKSQNSPLRTINRNTEISQFQEDQKWDVKLEEQAAHLFQSRSGIALASAPETIPNLKLYNSIKEELFREEIKKIESDNLKLIAILQQELEEKERSEKRKDDQSQKILSFEHSLRDLRMENDSLKKNIDILLTSAERRSTQGLLTDSIGKQKQALSSSMQLADSTELSTLRLENEMLRKNCENLMQERRSFGSATTNLRSPFETPERFSVDKENESKLQTLKLSLDKKQSDREVLRLQEKCIDLETRVNFLVLENKELNEKLEIQGRSITQKENMGAFMSFKKDEPRPEDQRRILQLEQSVRKLEDEKNKITQEFDNTLKYRLGLELDLKEYEAKLFSKQIVELEMQVEALEQEAEQLREEAMVLREENWKLKEIRELEVKKVSGEWESNIKNNMEKSNAYETQIRSLEREIIELRSEVETYY